MAKRQQLHWNQSLIVIAGDDDVELAPGGAHENGVAWKWTRYVEAARPAGLDRGTDGLFLFVAEQTVFPRVRIETSDGNARLVDAKTRQFLRRETYGRFK